MGPWLMCGVCGMSGVCGAVMRGVPESCLSTSNVPESDLKMKYILSKWTR